MFARLSTLELRYDALFFWGGGGESRHNAPSAESNTIYSEMVRKYLHNSKRCGRQFLFVYSIRMCFFLSVFKFVRQRSVFLPIYDNDDPARRTRV